MVVQKENGKRQKKKNQCRKEADFAPKTIIYIKVKPFNYKNIFKK